MGPTPSIRRRRSDICRRGQKGGEVNVFLDKKNKARDWKGPTVRNSTLHEKREGPYRPLFQHKLKPIPGKKRGMETLRNAVLGGGYSVGKKGEKRHAGSG